MEEFLGQYKARDGKPLSFRKWEGGGDVIAYLHGVESHSGWFSRFARQLAAKGFTVYGIDRRGSGLNSGQRGDISDYNIFLDDIEDALKFVKAGNPGKNTYLAGICWGAALAAHYAAKRNTIPDGLILLSPAIYRKVDLGPLAKIAARASSFFYPKARFRIPIRDSMFTDNRRWLDFIKNDAMRLRRLTCRFFGQIIRMETDFEPVKNKLLLPVIALLAGHDRIVDNKKVENWFSGILSKEKTIRTFNDFNHVMPFEEDITPLISCISGWISERGACLGSQDSKYQRIHC